MIALAILRSAGCPSAVLVLPFFCRRIPLRVRIVRIDRPVTLGADVLSLRNLVFVLTLARQNCSHSFWDIVRNDQWRVNESLDGGVRSGLLNLKGENMRH